jgi:hypothetical protein
MKACIVILLGVLLLPFAACGKKADVVPPPGYKLPKSQSEGK